MSEVPRQDASRSPAAYVLQPGDAMFWEEYLGILPLGLFTRSLLLV